MLHNDKVEQLTLGRQLQNEIDRITLVERILEAENVRVTDSHENCYFLLEPLLLRTFFHAWCFAEDLDGVLLTRGLLDAKEHLGKVTFAQLLQQCVRLVERARLPTLRISEDEAGFVKDSNLILFAEFSPLVSADNSLVDKGAVAGQIFDNGHRVAALVLYEEKTVAVGHDRVINDNIYGSQEACTFSNSAQGGRSTHHTQGAGRSGSLLTRYP